MGSANGRACGSGCRAGLLTCIKGSEKTVCSEGAVLTLKSLVPVFEDWVVVETLGVANSEGKLTSR